MQPRAYLDAIVRESDALAEAAARAGLDAPVPSCPDWSVADLLAHLGTVQQWARVTVETRATERIARRDLPPPPPPDGVLAWFRAQAPALVAALAATDPATHVWSWSDDQTAGFWYRRQAHEAAVHRWDAQAVLGAADPIATALAADGVDEALAMLPSRRRDDWHGDGATVHLHCTDTAEDEGGEWLVTLAADGPIVERRHAKGDAAVRGTASDLDLFVWGRLPAARLERFGPEALLDRFQSVTRG